MKEQNNKTFYSITYRKSFSILGLLLIMDEDLPESVKKCLDILEENVEILANLEFDLEDEISVAPLLATEPSLKT